MIGYDLSIAWGMQQRGEILKGHDAYQTLLQDQKRFFQRRDACGKNIECLREVMFERVSQLSRW